MTIHPLAPDPGFWRNSRVDVVGAIALAGNDTIDIAWDEKSGRNFEAAPFTLPASVPDTLFFEFEFELRGTDGGEPEASIPVRAWAVASKHRRWYIADMAES